MHRHQENTLSLWEQLKDAP